MIYQQVVGALEAIRDVIADKFEEDGHNNFCLLTLMPGEQVPFDYCDRCDDGMAWVRLASLQPPQDRLDNTPMQCFTEMSMTVEVGHIFSAPWPESDGDLPDEHDHTDATLRQIRSADLLLQALLCTDLPSGETPTDPTYVPLGPDGGCLGGAWSATVRVI